MAHGTRLSPSERDGLPELIHALAVLEEELGPDLTPDPKDESDSEAAGLLWGVFETWERLHRPRRSRWAKVHAMVHNDQWTDFDENGLRRRDLVTDEVKKSRVTYNRMIIPAEQFRSMITQERPNYGYTVANSTGRDASSSQACERAGRFIWRDYDLEGVYADTGQGAFNLGGHGVHVWWDKNAGRFITRSVGTGKFTEPEFAEDPLTGDQIVTKEETEITKTEEVFQGEFRFEQKTPAEVVFSPGATVLDPPYGVFVVDYLSRFEVMRRWPDLYDRVTFGAPDQYESGLSGAYAGFPNQAGSEDETEKAMILTFYMRQCPEYPRGRMVILNMSGVLEAGDNPWYPTEDEPDVIWAPNQVQWCPLFYHTHYRDGRHPYGRGASEDLVDPQASLNGKKSKELTILKKLAHANLLAPRGTPHVDVNDPAAVIEYDRRDGPESIRWLQPPAFPGELAGSSEDDKRQMDDIPGINAAIQGKSNADESGKKVEALQQRALGRQSEIKARLDRLFGRVLQYAIRLMVRHLEEDIQVTIVGENNRVEVQTLKVANLASTVDVYPLNDPLSADPFQRSMQVESVTRQLAGTDDTVLKNRLMALQRLDEVLYVEDSFTVHRDKAVMENRKMHRGQEPHPHPYDDDEVHIAEMTSWALSQDGIDAMEPEEDDPPDVAERKARVAAVFAEHLKFHEDQKLKKSGIDPQTGMPLGGAQSGQSAPAPGGAPAPAPEGGPPMNGNQGISAPQPSIAGV